MKKYGINRFAAIASSSFCLGLLVSINFGLWHLFIDPSTSDTVKAVNQEHAFLLEEDGTVTNKESASLHAKNHAKIYNDLLSSHETAMKDTRDELAQQKDVTIQTAAELETMRTEANNRVEDDVKNAEENPSAAESIQVKVVNTIHEDYAPLPDKIEHDYTPASVETYLMENMDRLHFNETDPIPSGCSIWTDKSVAPEIHHDLMEFREEIKAFHEKVDAFEPIPSVLEPIRKFNNHDLCKSARLHPEGLLGLFPSKQLSVGNAGYAEPLLPPMRHPEYCFNREELMNMKYLVFDFEKMCMDLKPYSRTVLIDLGASLLYHSRHKPPIVYLLELFNKFGIKFDHVYGYEITFQEPQTVFKSLLPMEYFDSYHWINAGVESEEGAKLNPLDSILRKFTKDDLVILKLDIDTGSIEVPLAKQLLKDESLLKIVDHFLFEHHVLMTEMSSDWKKTMEGSMKSSFDLFRGIREKGVMSHFWV